MIVAVYTGSRSEYGILRTVLRAIDSHPDLTLRVLVGGSHVHNEFGGTCEHITADGFDALVAYSVWTPAEGSDLRAQASGVGVQMVGVSEALHTLRPGCLVVYGDRSESLAAAAAAHFLRIPIAHIEGGDYTAGGLPDDKTRDAITTLASLHLTTNERSAERLRQLGAAPGAVHNVGLPSLDVLRTGDYDSAEAVTAFLGLDSARPLVILCQHPEPGVLSPAEQMAATLRAVEGMQVLVLSGNADPGSLAMQEVAKQANCKVVQSLPPRTYYGLLAAAAQWPAGGCMLGNSSSGVKEAPAFGVPALDVGKRQEGRLTACCLHAPIGNAEEIRRGVRQASSLLWRAQVVQRLGRWPATPYQRPKPAGQACAELIARWLGATQSAGLGREASC